VKDERKKGRIHKKPQPSTDEGAKAKRLIRAQGKKAKDKEKDEG
jgi:hypothetical protein